MDVPPYQADVEMLGDSPTVSVALCTYNGADFLAEQWQSLMDQHLKVNEIVCCDDGSSDNTVALLHQLATYYEGDFRFYQNETKLGPRKNFEKAISLCTGDIIFLCDQDDAWLPDKVAVMVQFLTTHPEASGVFCNGWLMTEKGELLPESMWDALYFEAPLRASVNKKNLLYYLLLNGNVATGTAMCFRKTAVIKLLPLFTAQDTWHDHWIALVLAAQQELYFIDQPLLYYRIHEGQQVGFPGRNQSAPDFRNAVHQTWKNPLSADEKGIKTTHLAWAIQTFQKLQPALATRLTNQQHLQNTGAMIAANMQEAKTAWLQTVPWFPRKIKMIKHWLSGGEYLRIKFKDVITI